MTTPRVIAVGKDLDLEGGRRLRITEVELLDGSVEVRTIEPSGPVPATPGTAEFQAWVEAESDFMKTWMLWDDLGTRYDWKGGGWNYGRDTTASAIFVPPVPVEATVLYLLPSDLPKDQPPIEVRLA
jgi:hypothetical protein